MATINDKSIIDDIIDSNGDHSPGEPGPVKIVEYINFAGRKTWGVIFEDDPDPFRYQRETPYVRNPSIVWLKTINTPYAVICREHGQVFLSRKEYNRQMGLPDSKWSCPICGKISDWDDENYEKYLEDEYFEEG